MAKGKKSRSLAEQAAWGTLSPPEQTKVANDAALLLDFYFTQEERLALEGGASMGKKKAASRMSSRSASPSMLNPPSRGPSPAATSITAASGRGFQKGSGGQESERNAKRPLPATTAVTGRGGMAMDIDSSDGAASPPKRHSPNPPSTRLFQTRTGVHQSNDIKMVAPPAPSQPHPASPGQATKFQALPPMVLPPTPPTAIGRATLLPPGTAIQQHRQSLPTGSVPPHFMGAASSQATGNLSIGAFPQAVRRNIQTAYPGMPAMKLTSWMVNKQARMATPAVPWVGTTLQQSDNSSDSSSAGSSKSSTASQNSTSSRMSSGSSSSSFASLYSSNGETAGNIPPGWEMVPVEKKETVSGRRQYVMKVDHYMKNCRSWF